MKSFLELARSRQSDRAYEPGRKIEPEVLNRILEAGRMAPSACNGQPYHFTVCRGEKAKEAAFHAKEWTDANAALVAKYAKEIAAETGQKASDMWNSEGVTKFRGSSKKTVRVVTGMQAVEDRRKSIKTREEADLLKAEIEETNEALRDDLNDTLETFGKYRLEALSATVGKFLPRTHLRIINNAAYGTARKIFPDSRLFLGLAGTR